MLRSGRGWNPNVDLWNGDPEIAGYILGRYAVDYVEAVDNLVNLLRTPSDFRSTQRHAGGRLSVRLQPR